MRLSFEQRFRAKYEEGSADACWEWRGALSAGKYGTIRSSEPGVWSMLKAHRVAYEFARGPIPKGLEIDHLCCNTRCVNPAHLEPVTGKENSRRYALTVTRCKQGHEFTAENTLRRRDGKRTCRTCNRAAYNRWYAERGGQEHRRSQRLGAGG